ncbi:hypothetical protein ACFWHR_03840 [Leucobacter sp. NPDC058333]|uniref:hypothetical protein n=1 Tax=Leucobacter sp. NPDC058333 TaxID=3346450 RepID=UPI00365F4FC9
MMTTITGRIADSAGSIESGRIEFTQAARIDTGELLVTQSTATAQVVQGELRDLAGRPFSMPANPTGTAVRIREILGGRTFEWWAAVPDTGEVEYRALPVVESGDVGGSVFAPPLWLATVEQMRDETVDAIEEGTAVAEALGGLAGITAAVDESNAARDTAAESASAATSEANRAEQAAASIDMTALNGRMDTMQTGLSEKADAATVATALAEKATVQDVSDAIAASKPNPNVESAPLWSIGHSFTKVPSTYTTPNAGEYPLVLARRCGFGNVKAWGRGSTPILDTFPALLAPSWGDTRDGVTIDRTWTPAARGVVLIENYMNELGLGATWLTQPNVDFWGLMLRSVIALVSSAQILPASAGTETGAWADVTSVISTACYGGALRRSNAVAGSSKSFTVTGDEAWILTLAGTSGAAGDLVAKCNGVTLKTIALNGTRPAYTSVVDATITTLTPIAIRVTGMNAAAGTTGSKSLRIEWPGTGSASHGFIHGVIIPDPNPPQIFVAQEPPRNGMATNADTLYRAMVETVAAEFPNVHVVDLRPGFDLATMISTQDTGTPRIHPNDLGQRHIAAKFEAAINAVITSPMPGVLTL